MPPTSFHPLAASLLLAAAFGGQALAEDGRVEFNRDIRPILSENCFGCHGPDANKRKAKLRLDRADDAHSKAIAPGNLKGSKLWQRITNADPDELMPPPETGKSLTADQREVLRRWIEAGAEYQEHWAFIAPVRPQAPAGSAGIDHFVRARLARQGLQPNAGADKRTLLRRVTLDLTGLPPSPEELADFLADAAPDAYEKAVDRLLASPRFGEHMARFWLDAVRYGDTHGLHLDNYREFWPYRDWVIAAFNTNKRYDVFLTEQLAGDLLDKPSTDQLVATGFNRAHVTTGEGGSIKEEVYVRNVIDRTSTAGTVLLGLTTGCAVCHDHKFDPISQQEFYQLFAYFNNLDADPMDGNKKDHAPVITVPTPEGLAKVAALKAERKAIRAQIEAAIDGYPYKEPAAAEAEQAVETVWFEDATPVAAKLTGEWGWTGKGKGDELVFSGERSLFRQAPGLTQDVLESAKQPFEVRESDTLFAHVRLDPQNSPKQIMLQFFTDGWNHRAYWGGNHIPWGNDNTTQRKRLGDLPKPGEWVRLEVPIAAVGLKGGDKITGWAFTQFDGAVHWDKAGVVSGRATYRSFKNWIADQRAGQKPNAPAEITQLLNKPPADLSEADRARVKRHYLAEVDAGVRELIAPRQAKLAGFDSKIAEIEKSYPTTLIWKERSKRKPAYILERGEYDRKGSRVLRGLPRFLPPLPEGATNDRLGVAKWLSADEHPLTARVAVNRFWQQLFGVGIVKTAEDFGSQGEWPSHPQLLDWLAVEFRESGWDVKRLMKLIVTSDTYRQSSKASPDLYRRDPENRLLARGPRFRLDAETLRDQALEVSGLLVEKVGGPAVRPPQPDGLWYTVGYSGSNTVRFKKDAGHDKVHRRTLYTFWKRTAPPPQMIDAPSRESCVVRRERTNTPLHALMFMNDPQFVEAARHFAESYLNRPDAEIAALLFERAIARPAAADELAQLSAVYAKHRAHYAGQTEAAKALVAIGETPSATKEPERLAAWTMVASLVMNLDEFLNKN